MKNSKFWFPVFAPVLLIGTLVGQESGAVRSWTNTEGKQIEAAVLQASDSHAKMRLGNGNIVTVPLNALSAPDQNLIVEMLDAGLVFPPPPESLKVDPDLSQFAVGGQGEPDADFVNVLKSVVAAAKSLPQGFEPKPGPDQKSFHIQLADSAGYRSLLNNKAINPNFKPTAAFLPDEVALYVNFLTIREENMTPRKMAELGHEAAALALLQWQIVLPPALHDGLAGCLASIPAKDGVVAMANHEAGLKQFLVSRFEVDPKAVAASNPVKILATTTPEWTAAPKDRVGAILLAYYFLYLDETKATGVLLADALASVKSLREESYDLFRTEESIAANYEEKRLAYNKAVEGFNDKVAKYKADVEAYKKQVLQYNAQVGRGVPESERIKVGDPPAEPELPEAPVITEIDGDAVAQKANAIGAKARETILPLLMNGRNEAELASMMKAAFTKIGVPVAFD